MTRGQRWTAAALTIVLLVGIGYQPWHLLPLSVGKGTSRCPDASVRLRLHRDPLIVFAEEQQGATQLRWLPRPGPLARLCNVLDIVEIVENDASGPLVRQAAEVWDAYLRTRHDDSQKDPSQPPTTAGPLQSSPDTIDGRSGMRLSQLVHEEWKRFDDPRPSTHTYWDYQAFAYTTGPRFILLVVFGYATDTDADAARKHAESLSKDRNAMARRTLDTHP
ncbi:hypothetical protein [Cryptosporangium minutisporangium]|uniref:Uncharacterized protein n=1 Tax=Cryptosporangium minutisporangium TaxID=113569 RepID=A0ABP6SYM9_9ACTN